MSDEIGLLVDLHINQDRQGPGSDAETKRAIELTGLSKTTSLKIADIGCGTGASTLALAKNLNAQIVAVDLIPDFLEVLNKNAEAQGLSEKIETLEYPMEELPFEDREFDVIWSEGAIYNMGFEKGVNAWKKFLKPNGILVASEITWTTENRPKEIENHWNIAYPEIATASSKIKVLEAAGYSPLAYFVLPERCWMDNYYRPLVDEFPKFLSRNRNSNLADEIVESERKEIALYKKFNSFYSYGMYIGQKRKL